ncbi:DUF4192 family protein [Galactobacter valiniphilus]|uniref:DUF4192 family protein n=1 Tax=Galactobacter valiniphilus TaxID=2676122 RepID=UPI003735DFCA
MSTIRNLTGVIAHVGDTLGFRPENSLVIGLLDEGGWAATARHDFTAEMNTGVLTAWTAGILQDAGFNQIAVGIYPPEGTRLAQVVALWRELQAVGTAVIGWVVMPTGTAYELRVDRAPKPIDSEAIAAHAAALPTATAHAWAGQWAPAQVAAFDQALAQEGFTPGENVTDAARAAAIMGHWGKAIDSGEHPTSGVEWAHLAAALGTPALRDMLVVALFDGIDLLDMAACEAALTGKAIMGPNPRHRDAMSALLLEIGAYLPPVWAANARAMLGWIEWAQGHGTQAGKELEAGREADPENRLCRLLLEFVNTGVIPEWMKTRPTA